jgi:uncharacterized protein (TIGR00255 family)
MTGFGEARHQSDDLSLSVEVRSVNNRYLKVTVRGSDPYPMLEAEVEKVVRRHVRRGTLLVHVRAVRPCRPQDLRLNPDAIRFYVEQVRQVCSQAGWPDHTPHLLANVLALPGVAPEPGYTGRPADEEWPAAEKVLEEALERMQQMRQEEGRAMAQELLHHHRHIRDHLELIRTHLPAVTKSYRERLLERVRQAIGDAGVRVEPEHLIREVALFADRTDVAEEVMRLGSHLDQFEELVRNESDGPGRKLEFVTQEMGREVNTIGSKAGDVTISRHVVEIKATLEKIREMVQNVE